MVKALERGDHLHSQRPRIATITRIVGRLTAACLGVRHHDPATGILQQLHGSKSD